MMGTGEVRRNFSWANHRRNDEAVNLPESVLHLSYVLLHLTQVAAAVKRELYFPQVRNNLHRLMLLAVVVAGAND